MIDLHSHVLPGVDDGPATMAGSLELLRAAEAAGISRMAATPHVRDDYPTAPETMHRLVGEVNAAAREAGIAVEVLPGAELDLVAAQELGDEELRSFGLGGNPRLLLLESPYHGWPLGLHDLVFRFAARGFSVVLAHPERNGDVQANPSLLAPLVESGVRVQLTAASVDGRFGRRPQASARELLGREPRPPARERRARGRAAADRLRGGPRGDRRSRARRLADPRRAGALLEGSLLPPRPAARRTGRLPRCGGARSRGLMRLGPRRRMPSQARREAVSSALRRPPACAATGDPPSLGL